MYYDLFAFLPEKDIIGKGDSLTEKQMLRLRRYTLREIGKKKYLKCRSAFGGIGIYRYDAVTESRYKVEKNTISRKFKQLCEHIPFNREISKKGALYICKDMKVYFEAISFRRWMIIWIREHFRPMNYRKMRYLYCSLFSRR